MNKFSSMLVGLAIALGIYFILFNVDLITGSILLGAGAICSTLYACTNYIGNIIEKNTNNDGKTDSKK